MQIKSMRINPGLSAFAILIGVGLVAACGDEKSKSSDPDTGGAAGASAGGQSGMATAAGEQNSADNGNYYCSILDGTGTAAREDGDVAANLTATEATYLLEVAAGPWAVTGAEVFAYRVAVTIRP